MTLKETGIQLQVSGFSQRNRNSNKSSGENVSAALKESYLDGRERGGVDLFKSLRETVSFILWPTVKGVFRSLQKRSLISNQSHIDQALSDNQIPQCYEVSLKKPGYFLS